MPIHDAMMNESFVITTKFGGITEYLSDESAFLIDHELVPVKPMSWNSWYSSDQKWANPSGEHLGGLMLDLYKDSDRYKPKLSEARKVAEGFSVESCAEKIEALLARGRP